MNRNLSEPTTTVSSIRLMVDSVKTYMGTGDSGVGKRVKLRQKKVLIDGKREVYLEAIDNL